MKGTEQALYTALSTLLANHSMEEILVADICKEAQTVRSVFYAYFSDKQDLINRYQASIGN